MDYRDTLLERQILMLLSRQQVLLARCLRQIVCTNKKSEYLSVASSSRFITLHPSYQIHMKKGRGTREMKRYESLFRHSVFLLDRFAVVRYLPRYQSLLVCHTCFSPYSALAINTLLLVDSTGTS